MSHLVGVLLNGIAQLEYDRTRTLPDYQAAYLDKMDQKMDTGIVVDGESVANPDMDQRARFVAANLVHAIKTNDEEKAAAMCSYLADRLPDLKQVKIDDRGQEVIIDMVFDEEYVKQVAVPVPKLH
ncbi:MAG: hypothetical protein OEY67_06250 [Gammaproteobacteria bacterium]|nr:hypothetical protein [Gammaproteobacteria bacterium]